MNFCVAVRDAVAFALVAPHEGAAVAPDDLAPEADSFSVMLKKYPCVFKNGEPHDGNRIRATWFVQNGTPPRVTGITLRCMKKEEPCRTGVYEEDAANVMEADGIVREVFARITAASKETEQVQEPQAELALRQQQQQEPLET